MSKMHVIETEVLGDIPNGFRLKVSVLDLGLYWYNWTARRSTQSKRGWWIQPQAVKTTSGVWKHTVEFDKSNSLWVEIEAACIDAVLTNPELDVVAEVTARDLTAEGAKVNLDKAVAEFGLEEPKAIPWLEDDDQ